jgi:glycosyltransferase involved in cell wall biosynthesis
MSARPTLLIVSYHCAPSPAVGGKRFSFLAREFTAQGYDVHIIANELEESPLGAADASVPLAGTVHRVRASLKLPLVGGGWFTRRLNTVLRLLLAPVGLEYFWARAATARAVEIAHGLPRGIVIATSPPHTAMIAGARIARRLGWPLVLDYRDPWAAWQWPAWRRSAFAQWLGRRIEARIVRRSAARVLNTPAMRTWFEHFFPRTPPARNFVVPNGFDPVATAGSPPSSGALDIVHAGEIYTGRSLVPVLRAAQSLRARFPDRPIRVTTYGVIPSAESLLIRNAGLEEYVRVLSRVPFAELRARLQSAHVLLAVVSDAMSYSTPYKVYDYMAVGRPILALAPRGAAIIELLAESGAGTSVGPEDVAGIARALEDLLFAPDGGATPRTERYRWSNLGLQYRAVLEVVAANQGGARGRPDGPRRARQPLTTAAGEAPPRVKSGPERVPGIDTPLGY